MVFQMTQTNIKDKYFYPIVILLSVYFLFRLINESQMIWNFPLDATRDMTAYIAMLFFLVKTGFHQLVYSWYNGFVLFQTYPPACFYLALPFYYIFKNITLSIYSLILLIYTFSFIILFYLGKTEKFSIIQRIFLFLFLFANPLSISYLLRMGRFPELFGWMIFLLFFLILIAYKYKPINRFFYLVIPIFSILILSHPTTTILSTPLILSLFLIKNNKQRLLLVISILIAILITSFWWMPFLINQQTQVIGFRDNSLGRILMGNSQWIMDKLSTIIFPVIFLILSYIYIKKNINKKQEFLFYLPFILIAILLITRLLVFVPLFNEVYPDSYSILFIFLSSFLLLKIKYYNIKFKKLVSWCLVLLPIFLITTSLLFTPLFVKHTVQDKEVISYFPNLDGRIIILTNNKYQLYAYATIYHNIFTPFGGAPGFSSANLSKKSQQMFLDLEEGDCMSFNNLIKDPELNISYIITDKDRCKQIKTCKFKPKIEKENSCLFQL